MVDKNQNTRKSKKVVPKILVGVMHVTQDPWLSIVKNGQLPIWRKLSNKNFSVIYFFGVSNGLTRRIDSLTEILRWTKGRYASYGIAYLLQIILRPWINFLPRAEMVEEYTSKIKAPALKVNFPELTSTMRWKKLSFLNHFLMESDAEFLIITTSSSLINFGPIFDYLSQLENREDPLYAGRIHDGYDCNFTSGSFTLLNRKSASMLLNNRKLIPLHVMDDIAFGTAFKILGIAPFSLASMDLDSVEKIQSTKKELLLTIGHFRFKSESSNSRNDVKLMKELMSKLG